MTDAPTPDTVLRTNLERLEQTGGRTPMPCRLERLLTGMLDPDTASVLRRLVEETEVPVQPIRQQLMAAGHVIGWGTLKQHRAKICTCFVGQQADV